jgi:hypothetical protein
MTDAELDPQWTQEVKEWERGAMAARLLRKGAIADALTPTIRNRYPVGVCIHSQMDFFEAEDTKCHCLNMRCDFIVAPDALYMQVPTVAKVYKQTQEDRFSFLAEDILHVLVLGSFDGPSYTGVHESPSAKQLHLLNVFLFWLKEGPLAIQPKAVFGHHHLGYLNCPGSALGNFIDLYRQQEATSDAEEESHATRLSDVKRKVIKYLNRTQKQAADESGVPIVSVEDLLSDALQWSNRWRDALRSIQQSIGIPATGIVDDFTLFALRNNK